jgi:hypothetical protein
MGQLPAFHYIYASGSQSFLFLQSCTLQYQRQYFEALIAAIIKFQEVEIPQCNVEAVFEHTHYQGQPAVGLSHLLLPSMR